MSPLTPWHFLLIGIIILIILLGAVIALRSKSPFSIFLTITLIAITLGLSLWPLINEKVYLVQISDLDEERYYQSEQILIKGTVRNVGKYPINNVVATVVLINTRGGNDRKASQFAQPTVFAEIFAGNDPHFKKNNIFEEHQIADHLNPGGAKTFRILMDYPPYFKKASYDVTARAQ